MIFGSNNGQISRITTNTGTPEAGTVSFQYNNHNLVTQRTDARGVVKTFTYNGLNQLTQVTYSAGYSYDAAGNLTNDAVNAYTYDAENRIKTVNGTGATYSYDGAGLRVKKVAGGTTTRYIYSGTRVIAEYANGAAVGSPTKEYIYSGSQLLVTLTGSTPTYHHADHLSARVATDATGSIVEDSDFYPFGGERVVVNSLDNHYKFTGKERDSESGLDYFQVRYYGSTLARFLSIDPGNTRAVAGDPQSWNAYAYVLNNPLFFVDPTGLASESAGQAQNTGPIKKCELDSANKCKPPKAGRNDHTARILCSGFSAEKCNQLTIFLFRSANLSVSGNKNVDRQIKQLVEDISKLKIKVEVEADEIGDIMGGEGLQPDAMNIMAATGLKRGYSPSAAGLYHASDRTSYVGVIINEFRDGRKPGAMTHETLHVLNRDINSENPGGRLREVRVRIQHLLIRLRAIPASDWTPKGLCKN